MNKRNYIAILSLATVVSIGSLLFSSCRKNDSASLGTLPVPSFTTATLTPTSDSTAWNLELINTTSTPSIAYWTIPGVGTYKGDTARAVVQYAGNYTVQLMVAGQGGTDSTSQTVNVPTDNPYTVKASFKYQILTPTSFANPQNLELINTSLYSKSASWAIIGADGSSVGTFTGDTAKVTIAFAGTYTVKLTATGNYNLTQTVSQTIKITSDNPYGLDPNGIYGVLNGSGIGLTHRSWFPIRAIAGVLLWDSYADVLTGIDAGGGGAWYYFGQYGETATDGTGRDAYFDDTSTFDQAGNFIYNDNNTIYCDGNGSPWTRALNPASPAGNYASNVFFGTYPQDKAWGSGNFTYTFTTSGGAMGLGTITVKGAGAHIGLPDKTNTIEQVTPTITSVTYDILRISTNLTDAGGTYDEIIFGLFVSGTGNNYWGFRYKSYR